MQNTITFSKYSEIERIEGFTSFPFLFISNKIVCYNHDLPGSQLNVYSRSCCLTFIKIRGIGKKWINNNNNNSVNDEKIQCAKLYIRVMAYLNFKIQF